MVRQFATSSFNVEQLANTIVIRGARWKGIDFSKSHLDSLRFSDGSIEDCIFDGSRCQDWRMWGMSISNTSFRSTDLRRSALGGIAEGKRNSFFRGDFTRADLRQTAYVSADMTQCTFANTKLSKVDFQGTVFVDCVFSGKLQDVLFYRHAFRDEAFPPNEMKGVDLRLAKLDHTEFRGLNMSDVRWPEDEDHVIVNDYRATLDRTITLLESRSDIASKNLKAILEFKRKWAGDGQQQGILSKHDVDAAEEHLLHELGLLR